MASGDTRFKPANDNEFYFYKFYSTLQLQIAITFLIRRSGGGGLTNSTGLNWEYFHKKLENERMTNGRRN